MKRGTTIYLYELAWILPSVAIPVGMLVALLVTSFGAGKHLPGVGGMVDPNKLDTSPPFDRPGVVETSPGHYEIDMVSQVWSFSPNEIHLPAGADVTFVATSRDVIHGLFIPKTLTNVMLLPGQIARVHARFDQPGVYPFYCHEYCGILHHTMSGRIIVESGGAASPPKGGQ